MTNQAGFTLIELVLVLVILSIVAVTTMPKDNGSQILNTDAVTQKMVGDLRYAQNLAMTSGNGYGMRITGATSYEIYRTTDGSIAESPYDHKPMQINLVNDYPGASISESDQNLDIVFNTYGQAVSGGGENIQIMGGSVSKTISISENSGFVSIQ